MMVLWCLVENTVFKFGFEKGVFLAKFHFCINRSMGISGKGELHFHQETPSLIGNQTNHKTNMFLPYYFNSCYESGYECIYIVINAKSKCSVFLWIFWAVYIWPSCLYCIKIYGNSIGLQGVKYIYHWRLCIIANSGAKEKQQQEKKVHFYLFRKYTAKNI